MSNSSANHGTRERELKLNLESHPPETGTWEANEPSTFSLPQPRLPVGTIALLS